jgi:hypothetical protein
MALQTITCEGCPLALKVTDTTVTFTNEEYLRHYAYIRALHPGSFDAGNPENCPHLRGTLKRAGALRRVFQVL